MISYKVFSTKAKFIKIKTCDFCKVNPFSDDWESCNCICKTVFSVIEHEYATNNDGSGLFLCYQNGDIKQLSGNMQFYAKDKKQLLRKLNSYTPTLEQNESFFGTKNGAKNYLKKHNLEEAK